MIGPGPWKGSFPELQFPHLHSQRLRLHFPRACFPICTVRDFLCPRFRAEVRAAYHQSLRSLWPGRQPALLWAGAAPGEGALKRAEGLPGAAGRGRCAESAAGGPRTLGLPGRIACQLSPGQEPLGTTLRSPPLLREQGPEKALASWPGLPRLRAPSRLMRERPPGLPLPSSRVP